MRRKLLLGLALVLLALCRVLFISAEDAACGPEACWSMDGEGTLVITGAGSVTARPWSSENVRRVILAEGITGIGDSLFEAHTRLTEVTLPDSLTAVGKYAFRGCTALAHIDLPAGVAVLGSNAFNGCSALTAATLREGLSVIGSSAFIHCAALEEITLPASLTEIGSSAFYGCSRLRRVVFSVTDPAWEVAFTRSCLPGTTLSALPAIWCHPGTAPDRWCAENGVVPIYLPDRLLALPEGLSVIGTEAFRGLPEETALRLPAGVTTIAADAFDPGTLLLVPAGSPWASWAEEHGFPVLEE